MLFMLLLLELLLLLPICCDSASCMLACTLELASTCSRGRAAEARWAQQMATAHQG